MSRFFALFSFFFILCFTTHLTTAQRPVDPEEFGYDWIDFDNVVFAKIPIQQTGITRIPYETLAEVRLFPTGRRVDPRRFRVFYRGVEMPIRVIGEDDGSFDPGDYIEVYSERNTGYFDSLLYQDIEDKTNPYFPIFSVKSHYFVSFQPVPELLGRRLETVPIAGRDTVAPFPFHIREQVRSFTQNTNFGEVNPSSILTRDPRGGGLDSRYNEGTGYTGPVRYGPNPAFGRVDVNFAVENVYQDSLFFPELEISIKGRVNVNNTNEVFVGTPGNLVQQPELALPRYTQKILNYTASPQTGIPFPEESGTFRFRSQMTTRSGTYTEYSVSYGKLRYPQTFEGAVPESGKVFRMLPNDSTDRVIEIPNPPEFPSVYNITDSRNVRKLEHRTLADGGIRFVVDQSLQEQKIWVVSDSSYNVATEATEVDWFDVTQIDPSQYDYLIITSKELKKRTNPIANYVRYRESPEGGGFRVLEVEAEQLYNTFTYGQVTPIAIRRFADFMLRQGDPKFLFIIGNGLHFFYRYEDNLPGSANWAQRNLIPPYGFPGTDYEYTAGLDGAPELVPRIPTGRLAANRPEEVQAYLDKVIEYESGQIDPSWRKNILQLSGGINANENRLFRSYTAGFAQIAEGDYLGGDVRTIAKQTTDFVEFFNISEQINEGVGLLTFFGHASLSVTDIEIGNVTDPSLGYNNKGRYPLILVNGCGSGDAYQRSNSSFARNWMFARDKGAIAFLAHSHIGFSGTLRLHTQTFYETAFADVNFINKSLGEVVKETARRMIFRSPNSPLIEATVQQVVLQGDPAIKLVPFDKPDYAITTGDIDVLPFNPQSNFVAVPDSFMLEVDVKNRGIIDKNRRFFDVQVRRTFPDGTVSIYSLKDIEYIKQNRVLQIPIITAEENREGASGRNRLEVFLDVEDRVDEVSEDNNYAELTYFFGDAPLLALFPREYSIVNTPETEVTLIAQNPNYTAEPERYLFQIDTTDAFNSGVKAETIITSREQIIRWKNPLPVPATETVHYWRVRKLDQEDTVWTSSSFVYIPEGPEGWSQSHFPQFKKAELQGINDNQQSYTWEFARYERELDFYAYARGRGERPYNIRLDGEDVVEGNCGEDRRLVMLNFDQFTGEVFRPFSGRECGNSLSATELGRRNIVNSVSAVPEGDWVVIMASTGIGPNMYPPIAEAAILMGADTTTIQQEVRQGNALVMVGRRGGTQEDFFLTTTNNVLDFSYTLSGDNNEGTVTSTRIGPAKRWNELIHRIPGVDNEEKGWQLDLFSETEDGQRSLVRGDIQENNLNISDISTGQSPYLRLRLSVFDRTNDLPEPNQLELWRVIYDEVPEGVLLYDSTSYKPNTVLEIQEGEPIQLGFFFENISGSDFDAPVTVRYEIQNQNSGAETIIEDTLGLLDGNETLRFQTDFASENFFGENQLLVTVNPRLQPEQRYDNNVLPVRFVVKPDDINPILDVAFDGKHIMDGDIVAPNPLISIVLQDESRVNIRQDTTGINLFLSQNECEGCTPQRINFSDPRVSWEANENNRFEIRYQPEPLADGSYKLTVQGEDLTGNQSGIEPYEVNFQVINESAITHFYPYPNPFSTRMRFVFTLTGREIPDEIKIQIMTISGKLVRTITREELGPLRIGDNITEFAWDGTDQFGDQLANGVYLYKVSLRDQDQSFEHRETPRDDLFKHDIGKIYIMR